MPKYIVWYCCGASLEVSKEDAFSRAYYLDNDDDRHVLEDIEGPNGEILTRTAEYKTYAAERERRYKEHRDSFKPIGKIEANYPDSDEWCRVEWIYDDEDLELLTDWNDALGNDRVRYVKALINER